jgi:hypothetical protein
MKKEVKTVYLLELIAFIITIFVVRLTDWHIGLSLGVLLTLPFNLYLIFSYRRLNYHKALLYLNYSLILVCVAIIAFWVFALSSYSITIL